MLKKYAAHIKGFVRTPTLVVLLVLIAGYYVWQVQINSFVGQGIERSSTNGAIFYIKGIWNKTMGVQQLQKNSDSRMMELLGSTKKISDKSGLYSFDVPESWNVTEQQPAAGSQLSKMTVESSNFSQHYDGDKIFCDSGEQLTVEVTKGEQPGAKRPDGGYGRSVVKKADADMGGLVVYYYVISDQNVENATVLVANTIRNGNTYNVRFVYDKRLNGGEFSYQEILHSFKFAEKK